MSIIIYEDAIRKIDISDHLEEVGNAVADQARAFSQVPAGLYPNTSGHPWQRSGDLFNSIQSLPGADAEGLYVDVGSDASHRGFAYPFWLETHGFGYLTSALESLDVPFNQNI